jgi:hypothetical protein
MSEQPRRLDYPIGEEGRRAYYKAWNKANAGVLKEKRKLRYTKIAARRKELRREKQLQLAGRTKPDTCEVCGSGGKIVFDHCHVTNTFRGFLCDRCNRTLGAVNDDPEILHKLACYVRRSIP